MLLKELRTHKRRLDGDDDKARADRQPQAPRQPFAPHMHGAFRLEHEIRRTVRGKNHQREDAQRNRVPIKQTGMTPYLEAREKGQMKFAIAIE
jgi:hypothetical protein